MIAEKINLYENREDVTLTAYILDELPKELRGRKRPAIIVCPGGGYVTCSAREGEPIALAFAAMGYHAFVLRYSTYSEGNRDMPNLREGMKEKPHTVYPAQIRELGKAMLILSEHEEEWSIDTTRIAICGFSAGAHNCALYGAYWHTPLLSEYYKTDKEVFRPAAVILGYTVSDYLLFKSPWKNPMKEMGFKVSAAAYLGVAEPCEELLKEVSPIYHITENMPPTFLWSTAEDNAIPVQHSLRMANALADANIPFETHIFEKGSHGLALANQVTAKSHDQIRPDVAKWMELVEVWLLKRFSLFS